MAKYTVERACGHTETVALIGKIKDREWRLEHVESNKLCYECYQNELVRKREEENKKSAELAREIELPTLDGSEKQVAWAETIRLHALDYFQVELKDAYESVKRGRAKRFEKLTKVIAVLERQASASWWINNRPEAHGAGIAWMENEALQIATLDAKTPTVVIEEAKLEAAVRPESPVTETVADIRASADALEIVFPEKRDDFRKLVKSELQMGWDGECWRRKLVVKNGTPADRAAEAGHRLLAAGFPVRIFDVKIREMAVTGKYEPECTRWILVRTDGKYKGWLAINWSRDEDFYKAGRRIAGSRWDKPSIIVPPESFEEVLDFAKMYGFKLSEAAQNAVDAARLVKEKALVVNIEALEDSKVPPGNFPPVLDMPVGVGIDDEFRD